MIPNTCIEVQTSPEVCPSVPQWFAEVVIISRHLASHGLLEMFEQQILRKRKRFRLYEPMDFLAPLIGYAISGEETLTDFFTRLAPFEMAFMALFGRASLPDRSSLCRFLAVVDRPCLEAFRTLFQQSSFGDGWTQETIGGAINRQGHRVIVFDVDGTRQAARQRALPSGPTLPAAQRLLDTVCAPGYQGRHRGEVVRTRTATLQMHSHQWIATAANKGNGLYREELASALAAIATYMTHFHLPIEMALVRLDGLYGNAIVMAQLIAAGLLFLTRGKCYELLDHPTIVRALAQTPAACVTNKTEHAIELFEGGWIPLGANGELIRVIVTRYVAPVSKKRPSVGKRMNGWIYELFLSVLPEEGFLPGDILDLYHGRGAFETVLADEDREQNPDRWCSFTECGQELWQITSQWIWNLRLALGKQMQAEPLRDIEWAPPVETPAMPEDQPDAPTQYGPWHLSSAPGGAKHPRFGADDFVWQDDGTLQCPAGSTLRMSRIKQENAYTQRVIYEARRTDCLNCSLREQCRPPQSTGARGRNMSAFRHLFVLPSPQGEERPPVLRGPFRWIDVAGRRIRRRWMTHWRQQQVEILLLGETQQPLPPPPRPPRALRSHDRQNWQDRRARNAWHGPPQQRITVAGVPAFLASQEQ
jgi:hypothetical protein